MSDEQPKLPSCPFCWDHKHKCLRNPDTGQCEDCEKHLLDCPNASRLPAMFYDAKAHAELFKGLPRGSLPSLDIAAGSGDRNIFAFRVNYAGRASHYSTIHVDGMFNTQNIQLVSGLDTMVHDYLIPKLRGSDPRAPVFDKVIMVIGYAILLCCTHIVIQDISTIRDGYPVANEYEHYNLHVHFQFVVLCRLNELLKESLFGIYLDDPHHEFRPYTSNAYAGGVVLRYYLSYLKRSLKGGPSSRISHMSPSVKKTLVDWFGSVTHELSQRIRRGCGQYSDWQTAIVGSLKESRCDGETVTLDLTLQQIKHTTIDTGPMMQVYASLGNFDSYLLPHPASPMLAVPGLSYGNPGEVEQAPSHVWGPLSNQHDTWAEETSVTASDLFPDLQLQTTYGG